MPRVKEKYILFWNYFIGENLICKTTGNVCFSLKFPTATLTSVTKWTGWIFKSTSALTEWDETKLECSRQWHIHGIIPMSLHNIQYSHKRLAELKFKTLKSVKFLVVLLLFHKTVKIATCLTTNTHQHKESFILLWMHYLDMIVCSEQRDLRKLQQSSQAIVRNFKSAGSSSLSLVSYCNLQYLCNDNIFFL